MEKKEAYLRSGELPLSDEELENVSGGHRGDNGSGDGKLVPTCAECGSENVTVQNFGSSAVLKCHSCGVTIDPDGIFPAVG